MRNGPLQKFIVRGGQRCLNPPPPIFPILLSNISAAVSHFAHLQNSADSNTGTDAAGLAHMHHRLVNLGLNMLCFWRIHGIV